MNDSGMNEWLYMYIHVCMCFGKAGKHACGVISTTKHYYFATSTGTRTGSRRHTKPGYGYNSVVEVDLKRGVVRDLTDAVCGSHHNLLLLQRRVVSEQPRRSVAVSSSLPYTIRRF